MEQTTLNYLRILIPGMVCYLGFFPIAKFYLANICDNKSLDFAYVTVFSLLLGAIYFLSKVQSIVTFWSLKFFINRNIFIKLVKIYNKQLNKTEMDYLKKKFMNVFYKLIDSDETLKRKGSNVYFNGIFWTSSADIFLLSTLFWFLYKMDFFQVADSKTLSNLFLFLAALSFVLHILSVIRHIDLSNEQLDFIDTYKREEVEKDFDEILQQMP